MNTIRQRLTRRLLLTLAALIGTGALAAYFCAQAALQVEFDAALRARADALIGLTEQDGPRVELEHAEELLRDYAEGSTHAFFEMWGADGTPFARSRSLRDAHLSRPVGPLDAPVFWNLDLPGDLDARALAVKFTPRLADDQVPAIRPPVILVVAVSREPFERTLASLQFIFGGAGVVLLVATALVIPRALRRELQPLDHFAAQVSGIDAATLNQRLAAERLPGELAPIAARLNELLARLEESFERERRFSADVAHEFRTPLAELHALAELSLKLPDTRTVETDRDVLAIAQHLESITTRLLALARGERGELPVQSERVPLASLVERVCLSYQSRAAIRQLAFSFRTSAAALVQSDATLLRSIVTNLVDNAVAYSQAGTVIEVEAEATAARFTLRVTNTPENLSSADLPHLFDRFWRKDAARTVDGHPGLGLALARSFARALGGDLTAEMRPDAKLTMTFRQ